MALAFWAAVFGVLYRILSYFRGVEELGPLLAGKLLGLVLLSFISILILSNVITALSSFFLAKDLDLLVSAPVDWLRLYLAKLGETLVHSSWMVALMIVPILAAYAMSYSAGITFIGYATFVILPMLVLPAVFGSATTLVLVNVFPARRTRDLLCVERHLTLASEKRHRVPGLHLRRLRHVDRRQVHRYRPDHRR